MTNTNDQPRIVDNGGFVHVHPQVAHDLVEAHLIFEAEDDEGELIPDTFAINEELLDEWAEETPPLTAKDVRDLHQWLPLLAKPYAKLTDTEIVNLFNYALSSPEWSVSLLEDLNDILRKAGRKEIRGATWARH